MCWCKINSVFIFFNGWYTFEEKNKHMKTLKSYSLLTILFVIAFNSTAQKNNKSLDNALEISGSVLYNDQKTSKYSISIYLDGIKLDSVYTKSKRSKPFFLDYNKVYTLVFQKENCIDKIIILNTHLPNGCRKMRDETYNFDVEMSQALIKNSPETEDYPVAVVKICKTEKSLKASEEYHRLTHKVIEVSAIDVVNID